MQADYTVIKLIGKGPASKVHLVEKDNHLYAAKTYDAGKCSSLDWARFQNQAVVLFNFRHPNVLKIYETFLRKDCMVLITEYCEGGSLDEYIANYEGEIPEKEVVDFMAQLCLGLNFLHKQGVIHRDVKPSNIFINGNKRVKLGDFGASRIVRPNEMLVSTAGTPTHLAPQMYASDYGDKKGYSSKIDMWALGVVLYELCTKSLPFRGKNINELMERVISGDFKEINPMSYSKWFINLIQNLLSTNESLRPSAIEILEMSEVRKRIRQFLEQEETIKKLQPNSSRRISPIRIPLSPPKKQTETGKQNDRSTGQQLISHRSAKDKPIQTRMFEVSENKKTSQQLKNALENLLFSNIPNKFRTQSNQKSHNKSEIISFSKPYPSSPNKFQTPKRRSLFRGQLQKQGQTQVNLKVALSIPVIQNIEQFHDSQKQERISLPCDKILSQIGLSPEQISLNKAFIHPKT